MSSFHHCVFLVFVCCVLYLMGCGCAVVVKCRPTRVTASGLNIFAFIIYFRWSSVDSKHSESGQSFAERCFSLRRDAEEALLASSGQVGPGSWCADAAVGIGNQRDGARDGFPVGRAKVVGEFHPDRHVAATDNCHATSQRTAGWGPGVASRRDANFDGFHAGEQVHCASRKKRCAGVLAGRRTSFRSPFREGALVTDAQAPAVRLVRETSPKLVALAGQESSTPPDVDWIFN